jgi:hypothetical protein
LRRPRFIQLFPFMLRRVTSLLYHHCHLEPVDDPGRLLAAAGTVAETWATSAWVDWRELGDEGDARRIGGFTGQFQLAGEGLDELGWVVLLATLFGLGRGAAYGAGQVRTVIDSA